MTTAESTRPDVPGPPNRIATSTYSFYRFGEESNPTVDSCIDRAAEMGFDGVEILQLQMHRTDNAYLQSLKRQAFCLALDLCGLAAHQSFLSPDADERRQNVGKTIESIELAYALGIPTVRVNTGRWGTSASFDELMANRGIEPPLDGYADASPRRRDAALCSAWRTIGAWPERPRDCCGSSRPSIRPGLA